MAIIQPTNSALGLAIRVVIALQVAVPVNTNESVCY